jgi:hypothetical protein
MSRQSTIHALKKIKYMTLGMVIGSGAALLLSETGLVEVEMGVGYILGLCVGLGIDNYKKNQLA